MGNMPQDTPTDMLRFLIILLCFGGLLCMGNALQVKKIKEGLSSDIPTQLDKALRPAYAFLHPKQRVFYKGVTMMGDYYGYFLATQLMAPDYLLEQKKAPLQPGDTVLVIASNKEPDPYFPKNDLQIIWQYTDAQYHYYLGKQI